MKVLHERVAGIDVHKDMIKVAIRSPGEKPWTRKTEILEFRTFYGVLQEMAIQLRRRGVTHVVMEASGVYTEPVYYALAEQDFTEVAVINPAHAKALKGHKTDARLGVRPDETVFLDDWDPYVTGARQPGLHAIRYQDNAQAIVEIGALLR